MKSLKFSGLHNVLHDVQNAERAFYAIIGLTIWALNIQFIGMKLIEYLSENHITMLAFAAQIGVDVSTIHRAVHGKVIPSRATMKAIYKATNGAVTPSDLVQLEQGNGI